jgi:hypothetical protein
MAGAQWWFERTPRSGRIDPVERAGKGLAQLDAKHPVSGLLKVDALGLCAQCDRRRRLASIGPRPDRGRR